MRHILYISLVLLIAGCTNEEDFSDTLSGKGKTPLLINATINTGKADSRASGNNFVSGDQLLTYIRHIKSGDAIGNYTYVSNTPNDGYNKLVTYTKGSAAMSAEDAYKVRTTSDLTSTAYWDDFSNSSDDETDLRTAGHGLQSYYGYCYNGGTLYSLTEDTGVLTWTVGSEDPVGCIDQSTATKVQNADLLWSPTQTKVVYSHGATYDANHNVTAFTIPYTHAMSQVTVKVIADNSAGFVSGTNPLASTELILNAMNIHTTLTAPSCATPSTAFFPSIQANDSYIKNVKMYAKEPYPDSHEFWREFVAIVAPGTKLKEGEQILEIFNAHGNNYTVTITAAMLSTDDGKWGNGLSGVDQIGTDGGKQYIVTQPGVNYHLDVTIKKAAVQAHSSLANWTDVNATANGDIYFLDDDVEVIIDDSYTGVPSPVNVEAIDQNLFVNNASFSLFRVQATNDNTDNLGNNSEAPKGYDYATRTNAHYTFESISSFKNTNADPDDYWTNAPELYWPNNSYKFYYRALAQFNSVNEGVNDIIFVGSLTPTIEKGTSVSQGTIGEGHDILWGTTPKHYGSASQKIYKRGYPIPPRTHGVPIVFEHAMSKVSFTLKTTNDESVSADNAKMELSDASFKISNLYTAGTIRIDDGNIDLTGSTSDAISANKGGGTNQQTRNLVTDLIVVPQTLGDDVIVTITFTDSGSNIYSTYTIPLKDCVVSGESTPITAWERGKNYSYTIHVEKEKVQLKVLVKDWDEVTGSGNAALEW